MNKWIVGEVSLLDEGLKRYLLSTHSMIRQEQKEDDPKNARLMNMINIWEVSFQQKSNLFDHTYCATCRRHHLSQSQIPCNLLTAPNPSFHTSSSTDSFSTETQ